MRQGLLPGKEAKERHFSDCIYLDPLTHTKIEEVGLRTSLDY